MTNDEAKVFTFELTVERTVTVKVLRTVTEEATTLGDATEQVWLTHYLFADDGEELLRVEHVATKYRRNG